MILLQIVYILHVITLLLKMIMYETNIILLIGKNKYLCSNYNTNRYSHFLHVNKIVIEPYLN